MQSDQERGSLMKTTFYDLSAQDADGDHIQMQDLKGKSNTGR